MTTKPFVLQPSESVHDELHDLKIKYEALEQEYNTIELENKEYKNLIEELQHQNDELKQQLSTLHELQQHDSALKPLVHEQLSSMHSSLAETDAQIQELSDELNLKNAEIRNLNREMIRLQTQNEQMSAALACNHEQKAQIKRNLDDLRDSSSNLHAENSQLRVEIHQLKQVRFKQVKSPSPRTPDSLSPQIDRASTKRYSMLNIDASELPSVSPYLNKAWTVSKSMESNVLVVPKRNALRDLGLDDVAEEETDDLQSPRFDVETMHDELTELRVKCQHLSQRLSKYEHVEQEPTTTATVTGQDEEKCADHVESDNDRLPYAFIDDNSSDDEAGALSTHSNMFSDDDDDTEQGEEDERKEMDRLFEKCQGEVLMSAHGEGDVLNRYEAGLIEKFRVLRWEFQLRHAYTR